MASTTRLMSVDADDGRWYWRLSIEAIPVAISSRTYQRQRECIYSLDQFLAAVAVAELPVLFRELTNPAVGRGPDRQTDTPQELRRSLVVLPGYRRTALPGATA